MRKNKIKIVNAKEFRQKRGFLYIKNRIIPLIKTFGGKLLEIIPWFFIYLFVLRLFGYKLTFLNFVSSIALYFVLEEYKEYYLRIKLSGKKK